MAQSATRHQAIEEISQSKRQNALDCLSAWNHLMEPAIIRRHELTLDERRALWEAHYRIIDHTISAFEQGLGQNRTTIAIAGTTSSGKSSLANLLCGGAIMPVGLREVSAGTVVIDHDDRRRWLRIPPIAGAPGALSGEWSGIPDGEIQERLGRAMEAYRELRERGVAGPAPRFELRYPTRLGKQATGAGLPPGFRLRILDLPGLNSTVDEHNREIIRKEVRPALCLVTYNSGETDPLKQAQLLREVVEQVRELRGSPARMLFILNRIDEFLKDADGEAQAAAFVAEIAGKIRDAVAEALPEHEKEARAIAPRRLSSLPALHAHRAQVGTDEEGLAALQYLKRHFASLMPEELTDELPGSIARWDAHQRAQVAAAVWQASSGQAFDEHLRHHITANIPALLMPHLVKSVADQLKRGITEINLITHAHTNVTAERFAFAESRLKSVEKQLIVLRKDSARPIRWWLDLLRLSLAFGDDQLKKSGLSQSVQVLHEKLQDQLGAIDEKSPSYNIATEFLSLSEKQFQSYTTGTFDYIGVLTDSSIQLQEEYDLPGRLVPLYDWSYQLGTATARFMETIFQAYFSKDAPTSTEVALLPPNKQEQLGQALARLRESGYGKYAESGRSLVATSDKEKAELRQIDVSLRALADVVGDCLKAISVHVADQEAERICDALELLLAKLASDISKQSQEIARDLVGLANIPLELQRIDRNLQMDFNLSYGLRVAPENRRVLDRKVVRKVGERRIWWTLWIAKEDITVTDEIMKDIVVEHTTVQSLEDVLGEFVLQARNAQKYTELMGWLIMQIETFYLRIDEYQAHLLQQYSDELSTVMNKVTQSRDSEIEVWDKLAESVLKLQTRVSSFADVRLA